MRSLCVVVDPPCFDDPAGLRQCPEEVLIEAFIAEARVERFDEPVLRGFARCDVMPFDTVLLLPFQHRTRGQLGPVVADDHAWPAARRDDPVEFASNPDAGKGVVGDEAQAFAAEVIDDGENTEPAA